MNKSCKSILKAITFTLLLIFALALVACSDSARNEAPTDTQPSVSETTDDNESENKTDDTDSADDSDGSTGGNSQNPSEDDNKDPSESDPPVVYPPAQKHKLAGTWYGWYIDLDGAYEIELAINDDASSFDGSDYTYTEGVTASVSSPITDITLEGNNVTAIVESETLVFAYDEKNNTLVTTLTLDGCYDIDLFLVRDDLVTYRKFIENIAGRYTGETDELVFDVDVDLFTDGTIDTFSLTIADKASSENENQYSMLTIVSGSIIIENTDEADICTLTFDSKQGGSLTFISENGETEVLLTKLI